MNVYNGRVQDQVMSLTSKVTYYPLWGKAYKKAVRIKYPRGKVLQRLCKLEYDKMVEGMGR